ncbi:MAG: SDR family oxidoreductase [Chrysiogenetes bacterium]|nr:SDR family oxidoreductase [Chrysiogenetes bacterium]
MGEIRYDDRVAIVTGAGGGLGREHALFLASRGAKVVVNDLGGSFKGEGADQTPAQKVVDEIKAAGGQAVANYDSVATIDGGKNIVRTALDEWGRVDIVINNAGILRDVSFHKMSEADWDSIFAVHVKGAFCVTQAAWTHMKEAGYGRVVVTSSGAGLWGNFGQVNYGGAKLALVGMMNSMRVEGAKSNIKVNAIAPIAKSRMTETVMPPPMLAKFDPAIIAKMVGYLVSEECELSGSIIEGGGGFFTKVWLEQHPGTFIDPAELTPETFRDKVLPVIDKPEEAKPVKDLQAATMGIMKYIKF